MAGSRGRIAIIGSGEMSDTMAETHRALMASLGEAPRPVFIDTMAGFELNADQIGQKAIAYFRRHFGLDLAIASYRHTNAPPESIAAAVTAIRQANYIFAGPGSPSYGIRSWRGSAVWAAILERWRAGAMLVFASAASITLGAYALPVYEIYKVGQDAHWIEGLNVLAELGLKTAVIPHWNNHSGDHHDTRYCFMGRPRMAALEEMLPADVAVLGVDEYTALVIDPATTTGQIMGVGEVIWRHHLHTRNWNKGDHIAFDPTIIDASALDLPLENFDDPPAESSAVDEVTDIDQIAETAHNALGQRDLQGAAHALLALTLVVGAGLEQGVLNRSEAAAQALQRLMPELGVLADEVQKASQLVSEREALIELLVAVRADLRRAKQWAAADYIRDGLAMQGVSLTDTPTGTEWQYASQVEGST